MRGHVFVHELSPQETALDLSCNVAAILRDVSAPGFTYQSIIRSLGLTYEATQVGPVPRIIIGGSVEEAVAHRAELEENMEAMAHRAGQIADAGRSVSLAVKETHLRHIGRLLKGNLERPLGSFAFLNGALIAPFAAETNPEGALVHYKDKTPWLGSNEELERFEKYGIATPIPQTPEEIAQTARNLSMSIPRRPHLEAVEDVVSPLLSEVEEPAVA